MSRSKFLDYVIGRCWVVTLIGSLLNTLTELLVELSND